MVRLAGPASVWQGDLSGWEPAIRQNNPPHLGWPLVFRRLRAEVIRFSEAHMANDYLPHGHDWVSRKVKVDGKTFFHRQCKTCRRDLVRLAETGYWRAVHVGLLGFDSLGEDTNRRWLSEECPRRPIPRENNDLRMYLPFDPEGIRAATPS